VEPLPEEEEEEEIIGGGHSNSRVVEAEVKLFEFTLLNKEDRIKAEEEGEVGEEDRSKIEDG
jgi:hypothetical protein